VLPALKAPKPPFVHVPHKFSGRFPAWSERSWK
jgi:hypothetical protein